MTQHLLQKHPVPWEVANIGGTDSIIDANGDIVLAPFTTTMEPANLAGAENLVEFINVLGPALPRLLQLDVERKAAKAFQERWRDIELTEADKDRIRGAVRDKYPGQLR